MRVVGGVTAFLLGLDENRLRQCPEDLRQAANLVFLSFILTAASSGCLFGLVFRRELELPVTLAVVGVIFLILFTLQLRSAHHVFNPGLSNMSARQRVFRLIPKGMATAACVFATWPGLLFTKGLTIPDSQFGLPLNGYLLFFVALSGIELMLVACPGPDQPAAYIDSSQKQAAQQAVKRQIDHDRTLALIQLDAAAEALLLQKEYSILTTDGPTNP